MTDKDLPYERVHRQAKRRKRRKTNAYALTAMLRVTQFAEPIHEERKHVVYYSENILINQTISNLHHVAFNLT